MNELICSAIRDRRRLAFTYEGRRRVVEPYCYGMSNAGHEVLRAIQVGGESRSRSFGGGKLWLVAKMEALQLGGPFLPNDPNYNPDDSALREIHCRI